MKIFNNKSETIGRKQNIECTASPILAQESTVRRDWDLNIHPASGGITHPYWQIKGLFTAFESYGRWPSGLAKFEIDAEEDENQECFIGDHALYYRKMALQGVCHGSGSNYENNYTLTDTLTELAWEESRNRTFDYIWDANSETWVEEEDGHFLTAEYRRTQSHLRTSTDDGYQVDEYENYDGSEISPLYDRDSSKYKNNPKYKWVNVLGEGHWRKLTDRVEIERRSRQVRWTHSEWVKAKCSPAAKICRCGELKTKRNRLGKQYNVFPKWKWCSSQPLFGFRKIEVNKLNIEEAHQVKFIPATLDGYYVDEDSETEELTA